MPTEIKPLSTLERHVNLHNIYWIVKPDWTSSNQTTIDKAKNMKLFNLIITALALNVNGEKAGKDGKLQDVDTEYVSYEDYANYAGDAELKMHGNG